MKHYRQFLLFVFIYLIHGNKIKIGGPLLVNGLSWDWLNCCKSSCCGGSDCCNSCGSSDESSKTTNSGEKLAEIILSNASGTGYKHERVHSLVTFTPTSGYSINVVKEKKQDGNKVESKDQSQVKSQDGTKKESQDQSQVKSQDDTNESKDEYNIIWKTDKKEEYASKVTVEFLDAILTIYIGSGESNKIVYKMGDDNKWEKDTQASTYKGSTNTSDGGTTPASPTSGGTTGTTPASGGRGSTQQSTPSTQ